MAIHETAVTDVEVNGQNAEQALKNLATEANKYKNAMVEAAKANDLAAFNKAEAGLKKTERAMNGVRKAAFDVNAVLKNLSGSTLKDLAKAKSEITRQLERMTRGTKEYIAASKNLQSVNKEISKVKTEMNGAAGASQGFFGKMGVGLKSFIGGIAIIGAVTAAFRKLINTNREFEKSISELSSLTGATGDDLKYYKQQAELIGKTTTVSAQEAVRAFTIIGSAKPELLKSKTALAEVTKQAVALAEASGMTVPEAADNLTKALNQFQLPAEEAARVINVLAAGSKEGAAAIPAVTQAMVDFGTVAKNANITIEESTGLIETLAERGLVGSEAGTKLRNVLVTLQQGANDTNPKVVGLVKALDNLGKKHLSTAEMAKLFGKENLVAAQILAESAPTVERYTKAVTATSVAYEQQKTMTDNLDGSIKRFNNSVDSLALSFNGNGGLTRVVRGAVDMFSNLISMIAMSNRSIAEIKQLAMDEAWQNRLKADRKEINKNADAFFKSTENSIKADEERLRSNDEILKNADKSKETWEDYYNTINLLSDEEIKKIEKRLELNKLSLIEGRKYLEQKNQMAAAANAATSGSDTEGADGKKVDPIKILEEEHQKERFLIMINYQQQAIDKEQFDQQMLEEDMAYLIAKMAILQKLKESTTTVEQEIAQKGIDILEKANKEKLDKAEQWLQNWLKIKNKEREEENKRSEESVENYARMMDQYKSITDQVGSSMGEAIGNFIAGNEDAAGEFGKTMVLTMLDAVHAVVRMSLVQIWAQSLAQPDSIATFGATGVGRALIISALVEAAFAGVKALVSSSTKKRTSQHFSGTLDAVGAEDGRSYHAPYVGYTNEPTYYPNTFIGSERGGEIVVDANRSRNIRMRYPQLMEALRAVPQHAAGTLSAPAGNSVPAPATADPQMVAAVRQMSAINAALYAELRKGIQAKLGYDNFKSDLDKAESAISDVTR